MAFNYSMNTIAVLQNYMNYTLDETPGMKALVMDADTIPVVSVLFSMTEIIQKEVYLVQQLSDTTRDTLLHLSAVCLLRPTSANMELLKTELAAPKYGKYYLYFTNCLDPSQIALLSHADTHEVVQKVMELYIDFMPINADLFISSSPNFCSITSENSVFWEQKTVSSITSLCLSLKKNPSIRFQQNSELSKRIADGVSMQIDKQKDFFKSGSTGVNLVILDRCFDPITPLLTEWTYQAMIHEFIGIDNGKVQLNNQSVVLSDDVFYTEHMYQLFSDITDSVIKAVNELTQKAGVKSKQYNSLEEMRQVIDSIPQMKKESAGVKKHLGLMGLINKAVSSRKMLDVSRLEQEIVCSSGRAELFTKMTQLFAGDYMEDDKIRVGMLYALKYEERAQEIIQELIKCGVPQEKAEIVGCVIKYGGASKRPIEIFPKAAKAVLDFVKKSVAGVENIFVQHKPVLELLIDSFLTQQSVDKFPYCRGNNTTSKDLIIFIVGGATFEEEVAVANRNRISTSGKIILGGTDILNTNKFLEQVINIKQ
ncbi:vacuolar protein sorting-associated, putative [Entamoeba invadens IP1]|uniref:Vacuolar protein sorting-associated, putative n=1 Tax=Entamoeba invadens IP1 TaxID=370355 RepID=A0A0A1U2K2_ENTIV|nr:vacuolar protein sorting-associated, putative [Entamoeba invadens IP1]ELP88306.1 vacuolar protein sorting-associated, putative [Entamoeba invadens IP1]|eukprot:XP_004255077.1 vacuolar protein sorting-associated, putative [Entamoeba invadens IP1]